MAATSSLSSLQKFCGLNSAKSPYYQNTASAIAVSESDTMKVYETLRDEFQNPFTDAGEKLVHLSSGVPISADIAESVLQQDSEGKRIYNEFRQQRLLEKKNCIP